MLEHFEPNSKIYVQTGEPNDFVAIPQITYLSSDFVVHEENFSRLPHNSVVILDDFSFRTANNKQGKLDFYKVVNFYLRHHNITLILVVHNLFNNNLSNDILNASHIFLSYSNLGYQIMRYITVIFLYPILFPLLTVDIYRKLYMRLGGLEALNFYQEIPKSVFHFAYVNTLRSYIINKIENLFNTTQKVEMFANKNVYIIHEVDQYCVMPKEDKSNNKTPPIPVLDFISNTYPSQKFLKIVGNILVKHDILNSDLFFKENNAIHLADFLAYINNRFDKQENTRMTKLCKMLQSKNIKFPCVCVRNNLAKRFLC